MLSVVAEGYCDILACRKLIHSTGHEIEREFNCRGKGNLDKRLHGFVAAAEHFDWLVLRDLDADDICAPQLIARLVRTPLPARLRFRIAVRAVEAWLFSDAGSLATWLKVSEGAVPRDPEALADPKAAMAHLAARSRDRNLREGMTPDPHSGARVGPEYESCLADFVQNHWSPESAIEAGRSNSLGRAMAALKAL